MAGGDRPDTDRIDEDGGAAEVVGDEPFHCRERRMGKADSKGVEGAEPLARCAMWHIAWAGSCHLQVRSQLFPCAVSVVRELVISIC